MLPLKAHAAAAAAGPVQADAFPVATTKAGAQAPALVGALWVLACRIAAPRSAAW